MTRLLVATDGSEAAAVAIDLVAATGWPDGSVIRVVDGRSRLSQIFLGSVSRNVLHHARCSVLIVRETEPPAEVAAAAPQEVRTMNATTTQARPHAGLLAWLAEHKIEYELHEHGEAFTAQGVARAEGVDPRTFAKVIAVATDDGRRAFVVLDATDLLDLRKARSVLMADQVRLLDESELGELAPGCAIGAMPAVGSLFGLPMYADFDVREDPQISFNAGSHRISVRVDRAGWEEAALVRYADLAVDSDTRPAWARS